MLEDDCPCPHKGDVGGSRTLGKIRKCGRLASGVAGSRRARHGPLLTASCSEGEPMGTWVHQRLLLACVLTKGSFAMGFISLAKLPRSWFSPSQALFLSAG